MKKLLIFLICFMMMFSSLAAFARFDDIDENTLSWAGEAIDFLADAGVINGYSNGTFKPNGNITRVELAKMLTVAFDLEGSDAYYEDVLDIWAIQYVMAAESCMYVPTKYFEPDKDATRADIAYAVSSALNLKPTNASLINKFDDADMVINEMKINLAAAIEKEIIKGYEDNTLRPNDSVTRAEAAVIIYRALNIKNAPEDETPEVPLPPADDEKPADDMEHIYTLYPCEDVLLITSISQTMSEVKGKEAYRINYRIANSEEEYSSLIAADTIVKGTKTSVSELRSGDVMIMDTALLGRIGCLYVFASAGGTVPTFDTELSSFGDYTIAYGKVTDVQKSSKVFALTLDTGLGTTCEYITKSTDTNVYAPWKKAEKWSLDGLGSIDPADDDTYVFIRYTDGLATEIVVFDTQSD